jgi:hypothetical protein
MWTKNNRNELKFLCIRNYFIGSSTRTRWTKGKWYVGRIPTEIEEEHGIAYYIDSDETMGGNQSIEYFVKKKDFVTYFKTDMQVREEKLNQILDVGDSNDVLVFPAGNTRTGL